MPTFWAEYAHPAGGFRAEERDISGETRKSVLEKAQRACPVTRYLHSIWSESGHMMWSESAGWTPKADETLPT